MRDGRAASVPPELEARLGYEPRWEALHSPCVAAPPPGRGSCTPQVVDQPRGRATNLSLTLMTECLTGSALSRAKRHACRIVFHVLRQTFTRETGGRELGEKFRFTIACDAQRRAKLAV